MYIMFLAEARIVAQNVASVSCNLFVLVKNRRRLFGDKRLEILHNLTLINERDLLLCL